MSFKNLGNLNEVFSTSLPDQHQGNGRIQYEDWAKRMNELQSPPQLSNPINFTTVTETAPGCAPPNYPNTQYHNTLSNGMPETFIPAINTYTAVDNTQTPNVTSIDNLNQETLQKLNPELAKEVQETSHEPTQETMSDLERMRKEHAEDEAEQRLYRFRNMITASKVRAGLLANNQRNETIRTIIYPIVKQIEKELDNRREEIENLLVKTYQERVYDVENDSFRDLREEVNILICRVPSNNGFGPRYFNLLTTVVGEQLKIKIRINVVVDCTLDQHAYEIYLANI